MTKNMYEICKDHIFTDFRREMEEAAKKRGKFNSTHEGYAVIQEEVDELWDAIKNNEFREFHHEAIQIGAMAARFILDFCTPFNEDGEPNVRAGK